MWLLVWTLVIGSAVAIYYYLRIVLTMARTSTEQGYDYPASAGEGRPTLVILGVVLVLFGTYPAPLIDAVRSALQLVAG